MLTNRPHDSERFSFLSWWLWTKINLEFLISNDLNKLSKKGRYKSITKLLLRAIENYFNDNKTGAVDLASLINLIDDLDYLRFTNFPFYLKYRLKLKSGISSDFSFLTGNWFEVRIARLLTAVGIKFTQPEPPDFFVKVNDIDIGIECHAPGMEIGNDVKKKIIKAVKKKERKYQGQEWTKNLTILFLDATWLIRADGGEIIGSRQTLSTKLQEGLLEGASHTTYDLIIAFWFGHAIIEKKNRNSVSCVYAPKEISNPTLIDFRDQLLQGFGIVENGKIHLPDLFKD